MIKIIKDSNKSELIEILSDKLNDVGFKVLDKSQDYEKDIHIRIQSKDSGKTNKNLEQSKENIQKVLSEFSEKNSVNCEFTLNLKNTTYIDGSIQIKTSKEISDMGYEYFGTEKLKRIAKLDEAELLKSDGKKEYNDEYYIVINNKKEKLNADSDKSAIKLFKEKFSKKKMALDSAQKNLDVINFLQSIKDKFANTIDSCNRTEEYIDSLTADNKTEEKEYNLTKQYMNVISETLKGMSSKIDIQINRLKSADNAPEQALFDFDYNIGNRLNAGESLVDLMKELEQIYNSLPNKEEFEIDFEDIKNNLIRKNNILARKKVRQRGGNL